MENSASPIIIESSSNSENHPGLLRDLRNRIPQLLFALLAVVVLAEIYIGFQTLKPIPALPKARPLSGGILSMEAIKKTYQVGEIIPVGLILTTGGRTVSAVDALVNFDSNYLEGTNSSIIIPSEDSFQDYPQLLVDQQKGLIQVSAVSFLPERGLNGIKKFAIINLRAKRAGSVQLTFDFKSGSTIDSNVLDVKTATDILDKVNSLSLEIK